MLAAHNATVRIGGRNLIEDITLAVEPGEVVAIVGPNGAGKSTLVKALSGDIRLAAGRVEMNGRALGAWRRRDAARLRGILPQASSLSFPFRAHEVVLMGRAPHIAGVERPRDYEIARSAMALAEVGHLWDRLYPTLSGGEQQRIQLSRVLAQIWDPPEGGQARVLILDEPTSSLDIAHQHAVLAAGKRLAGDGVAVLAVLHDLNLAIAYADRIAVLDRGRLVAVGSREQVCESDLLSEVFGVRLETCWDKEAGHPFVVARPNASGSLC